MTNCSRYRLEFSIPGLPRTTNQNSGRHWAKKAKDVKEWHSLVSLITMNKRPKAPLKKAKLSLCRHSTHCPDYDGLVSSFKHVIDGLIRCGILIDDNMSAIGMPSFSWEKSKRGRGFITVLVESVDE